MRVLKTSAVVLLSSACFLAVHMAKAQYMNAHDAPCQHVGSNADETSCFIDASKKADAELNQVYGVVLTVIQGVDLKDLKSAQRLWIQFRDSNCTAERELYYGGSAAPTVYYACIEAMTRNRITELKTMYGWRLEK